MSACWHHTEVLAAAGLARCAVDVFPSMDDGESWMPFARARARAGWARVQG